MGRGDQKTAKGKRARGSYGVTRKRKEDKPTVSSVKKEKKVATKTAATVKATKAASPKKVAAPKKETVAKKAPVAKKTTTTAAKKTVKKPAVKKVEK